MQPYITFIPIVATWEHPRIVLAEPVAVMADPMPNVATATPATRSRVLRYVYRVEPVTVYRLAEYASLPLDRVEAEVSELLHDGQIKQWQDCTAYGEGRWYLGTVNRRGLSEPEPCSAPCEQQRGVDVNSILALVRRLGSVTAAKLTRQTGLPHDKLLQALEQLKAMQLIHLSRRKQTIYAESAEPLDAPADAE